MMINITNTNKIATTSYIDILFPSNRWLGDTSGTTNLSLSNQMTCTSFSTVIIHYYFNSM